MEEKALKQYRDCWFIRAFEAEIAAQAQAGNVPGLVHLSTGSEVADMLIGHFADPHRDQVTCSHRSHGIALACGADPVKVAGEILGREGGLSGGIAGTQHLIAPEAGFLTSNGIVGAQVPLAAGAALSAKAAGLGGVGVAIFGDGAANQGAVFETMNLAVALKLPLIFALYNNGMAQSTPVDLADNVSFSARAKGFGLQTFSADSADYQACAKMINAAFIHARSEGPVFIEVAVTRDHGHYLGDGEKADFEGTAAMAAFAAWLKARGVSDQLLRVAEQAAREQAKAAVEQALNLVPANASALTSWREARGQARD